MIRLLNSQEIASIAGGETEGGCIDPNPFPPTMEEILKDISNPGPRWDELIIN
jgi:hypothetical protein